MLEVWEMRKNYSVFKKCDKIIIAPKIVLEKTDAVCIHALLSLLHCAIALNEGVDPVKLGLSKDPNYAYIQCVDSEEPYTDGGTVIFRCKRVEK